VVPIQTKMIDPALMKPEDVAWLDDYHREVRFWGACCWGGFSFPAVQSMFHHTNQPTNQPANQPTSQPTNQPANQPASQPTNNCMYQRPQVWEAVSPRLADRPRVLEWLRTNTRPLAEQVAARAAAPAPAVARS